MTRLEPELRRFAVGELDGGLGRRGVAGPSPPEERSLVSVTLALSGMAVRTVGGGTLGWARDVAVDPDRGLAIGVILVLPDTTERVLASAGWQFAGDAAAGPEDLHHLTDTAFAGTLRAARDILGLEVVSRDCRAVGSVRDVLVCPATGEAAFRVGPPYDNLTLECGFVLWAGATRGYATESGRIFVREDVAREIALAFGIEAPNERRRGGAAAVGL